MAGVLPPRPQQVLRAGDRISYLYLEHCTLGRDGGALTSTDEDGVIHVPVSALNVLLLGPGTRVTHQAVTVAAESGCSLVWVGEEGVRYYAHGRSIARSSRLLTVQAEKVSKTTSRLAVARQMYGMRFPNEDTAGLTMQQLRGKEGARVRRVYRQCSEEFGVEWDRRTYDPENFSAGDPINQALSAAHACMYGLTHAVVVSLGCSPGLGFVHTGHDRSFVYDVADLYKAEISIPVAFRAIRELHDAGTVDLTDIGVLVRRKMRDEFRNSQRPSRIADDVKSLLLGPDSNEDAHQWADVVELWDGADRKVAGGSNYAPEELSEDVFDELDPKPSDKEPR